MCKRRKETTKRTIRQAVKEERRGAAMVMVLCLMAIFLALSITIMLAASVALHTAQQNVLYEECRIQAVTFCNVLDDAMDETDSSICSYLKDVMTDNGKFWSSYNGEESTIRVCEADAASTYYPIRLEMHWLPKDNATGEQVYNGRRLFIDVVCTMDETDFHVQSCYTLACDPAKQDDPQNDIWTWTLQTRR